MPTPSASEPGTDRSALTPDPAQVARFRDELARLIDIANDRVLVALSGGADSSALLLLTHALLGARCAAATVDHGIREEAAAEAAAAGGLCARVNVGHAILTGPLPARTAGSANLSARARALRYELLEREADRVGAAWIATGHHADDQLETLLMRLNRGAGVSGLASIRPVNGRAIRPLLEWRRSELAAIVAAAGVTPVADPSNHDDRYDRARLRKTLGQADWLDPARIKLSLAALADADDALDWSARELLGARTGEDRGTLVLDPADLPAELVRRFVQMCLTQIDPGAAPDGPALTRLIASMVAGRGATLAGVRVQPGARWRFSAAPPRRSS